jgi:hypothetical protein
MSVPDLHILYAFRTFANLEQSSETSKDVFANMCVAIREQIAGKRRAPSLYCPPPSLNGLQCLVRTRWRNRPFLHLPPKETLEACTGFPPNAEDFEIGVVVSIKHEDCG